ncbi:hypothetical protein [uncultured Enterovirga sp.]|uniref:hypothetical protein n=1 Tax=uncultured Enterovirga sp. TaxID=2026352 RepID=UPI0035CA7B96
MKPKFIRQAANRRNFDSTLGDFPANASGLSAPMSTTTSDDSSLEHEASELGAAR